LRAIHADNETLHDILPPKHGRIIGTIMSTVDVFTQSGSFFPVYQGCRVCLDLGENRKELGGIQTSRP
jgi:hypothetical protein